MAVSAINRRSAPGPWEGNSPQIRHKLLIQLFIFQPTSGAVGCLLAIVHRLVSTPQVQNKTPRFRFLLVSAPDGALNGKSNADGLTLGINGELG